MEKNKNIYELKFEQAITLGLSISDTAISVTEMYLAGKPARRRKNKVKAAERNSDFWSCDFLTTLSSEFYESEPFTLALARYMEQEKTDCFYLVHHISKISPEAVRRAVRYSKLVQRQDSERWKEIEKIATIETKEFSEFIKICHTLDQANRERITEVEMYRTPLFELSPLELLTYASLYAFEYLIPKESLQDKNADTHNEIQATWDAINDTLIWKLSTTEDTFHISEEIVGQSLREHLSPFLFPSPDLPRRRDDIYQDLILLIDAQIELNSFLSQSVDAFCYNDNIRFELSGSELIIVKLAPDKESAWDRNGKKLSRLHNYWYYRALESFSSPELDTFLVGRLGHNEMNLIAYMKATRTYLQLTEIYGLNESIIIKTGQQVDLFRALLSLELMTAFYNMDYILPYQNHLTETGNSRQALSRLAMEGLIQGLQNRFPITWSDRQTKIKTIQPWTVSENFPQGHPLATEAILDFWTNDLKALSSRLRNNEPTQKPELFELPILKMGRYLFQLPWVAALQNNSTAAINNLRRLGSRRSGVRKETEQIEHRLAKCFEERGFLVCLNYQPTKAEFEDPGEVDLICMRDGHLLVLEVKSTFLRKSTQDAWLHKTKTLRRAGLQLRRKVKAVETALVSDDQLALALNHNKNEIASVNGWIVDTSIEHDHELFSGFLKVSIEEILIALRDDSHLLNDPNGLFTGKPINIGEILSLEKQNPSTLYPNGFSGGCFIDVIEQEEVWEKRSYH